MNSALVINFLGEPSTGKSTAAAYVFSQLKKHGVNCEYVAEYAKDKVYEECDTVFKHQEYIFGKQAYRMARVADKVDVIVTDSPIILSAIYNEDDVLGETFNQVVLNVFNSYRNFNVLLTRKHEYQNEGRIHDEIEAANIRRHLVSKLEEYHISYSKVISNMIHYDLLIDDIIHILKENTDDA